MRPVTALIGLPALVALAGCGYGHHNGNKYGVAGAQATRVTATETEFHIALSQQSLTPGTYTIVAQNNGKLAHSLEINGPGVSNQRISGTIMPGQSKTLTVTLQKGSYEIFCPVPGHKQQGMDLHISVGGAPSGGMTTTSSSSGGGGGGGY